MKLFYSNLSLHFFSFGQSFSLSVDDRQFEKDFGGSKNYIKLVFYLKVLTPTSFPLKTCGIEYDLICRLVRILTVDFALITIIT